MHISLLLPHCIREHGLVAVAKPLPHAVAQTQNTARARTVSFCIILIFQQCSHAACCSLTLELPLPGCGICCCLRSIQEQQEGSVWPGALWLLSHDHAHTKYHSGLVVSKTLGAGEEKAIYKARQKLESPLLCSYHHCVSVEQGVGAGLGLWHSLYPFEGCPAHSLLPQALQHMSCCRNRGSTRREQKALLEDSHHPSH